ncbi:helix-turn-helix transcriptional regulator [Shewanella algae]|uniref:helix-turn-helix transcriptional regulator n=1 Tax=Shewanella algae TaxID=38313 RepID=UPI001C5647FE|nr:helix-turn-helix domain-containing protein [Shewanella algae]
MARVDTKKAAIFLFGEDGKAGTLEQWRYRKVGPKFIKVGKLVRYEESDLQEWLDQQKRTGTSHQNLQTY